MNDLENEITRIFIVVDNYGTNTEARQEIRKLVLEQRFREATNILDSMKLDAIFKRPEGSKPYSHDTIQENSRIFGIINNRCGELAAQLNGGGEES